MSDDTTSLEFYRMLVEYARDMITVVESDGRIAFQSPSIEIHLGYGPAELIGKSVLDLVHPDDVTKAIEDLANIEQLMVDRKTSRVRLLHRDGSWWHVEVTGTTIPDETGRLILTTRDVNEQEATVRALRRSEEFFQTAFNATSAICSVSQPDTGELIYVNDAWVESLGWSREEAIGKTSIELGIWPSSAYRQQLFLTLRETGRLHRHRAQLVKRDGNHLTVIMDAEYLDVAEGRLTFVSAIDVTASEALEAQLRQSQKLESLGQLTGGIAHDFNNMLSVVMGHAELLSLRAKQDDASIESIETIKRAAGSGARLIQQLLAFSRKQRLLPQPVELSDRLRSLRPLLQTTLGKEISLVFDIEEDDGLCEIDIGQLESAILNLALNARDAMPDGGTLTIALRTEDLASDSSPDMESGRYYRIEVCDTGTGMSDEVMEHAFEPFFTTKDTGKGSGLGLSQVFGFTAQSGGHVLVHSGKENRGLTVSMLLPRFDTPGDLNEDNPAEPSTGKEALRILLIEDDAAVRPLVTGLLESMGHVVESAVGAEDALRYRGPTPDLIFSDVMLPGEQKGPEMASVLRARYPGAAVLFMSGYHPGEMIDEIQMSSMHFIQKPFEIRDLAVAIEVALELARSSKADNPSDL